MIRRVPISIGHLDADLLITLKNGDSSRTKARFTTCSGLGTEVPLDWELAAILEKDVLVVRLYDRATTASTDGATNCRLHC